MSFDGVNAYPLSWPVGWKRTLAYQRKNSTFAERSLAKARDFVLSEVRLLKGRNVVISTNVILRLDGLPKSGQKAPVDPGAAVYFNLNGQPKVLACDKWRSVEDNLWAIGKHIEAIRGQERWGVGTIDQAFMGYEALPAPKVGWWEVLGVDQNASIEEVQTAYRNKAKTAHPDAGGNNDEFLRIQAAWEAAKKEREK
jgi:hypothetical protein